MTEDLICPKCGHGLNYSPDEYIDIECPNCNYKADFYDYFKETRGDRSFIEEYKRKKHIIEKYLSDDWLAPFKFFMENCSLKELLYYSKYKLECFSQPQPVDGWEVADVEKLYFLLEKAIEKGLKSQDKDYNDIARIIKKEMENYFELY